MDRKRTTYEEWRRLADLTCERLAGLSLDDLPDCAYRDWYEDGMSAAAAAKAALRNAGGEM